MEDHMLRARLEAHEALEPVARVLKQMEGIARRGIAAIESGDQTQLQETRNALRTQRDRSRTALTLVRQAQAGTLGIRVETTSPHPQGTGDTHGSSTHPA